ncbi:hypothetical protein J2W49_000889 [Hydrogenophaga palleronii]|uniref:Uncharacterized protein n=1 Tax=Hydrogenophaga palleronii TaxID=65655 RepID=A0ABU1WI65_9BURK|nr:hypothetical protein [Hydrogenophaga palleronii]MDR7148961.1 hypothetical protein [Hydrogenophaga palleronii]
MSFIHHPAFQSLGLPLLLTLVLTVSLGMRQTSAGLRWWAMGSAMALLLSFLLLPGFDWPATARAQKLPWIALGGTGLAFVWVLSGATQPNRWMHWAMGSALWAVACVWLTADPAQWAHSLLGALAGAAVLASLLIKRPIQGRTQGAHEPPSTPAKAAVNGVADSATLTVAALGLAGIAAAGGSLLLAQLAMMLGVVTAVPGLWAWLRPAAGLAIQPAALFPLGLAWLVIAYSLAVPGPSTAGRVAVIALAFAAPVLLKRASWSARHPRWTPLLTAMLAALPVVVALAWLLLGDAAPPGADGSLGETTEDDPYYKPTWE